jgi:hypothetical protein
MPTVAVEQPAADRVSGRPADLPAVQECEYRSVSVCCKQIGVDADIRVTETGLKRVIEQSDEGSAMT